MYCTGWELQPSPEYSSGILNGVSDENSLILAGIRTLLLQLGTALAPDAEDEEGSKLDESQHSPVSSSLTESWSKRRENLSSQGHSISSPILYLYTGGAIHPLNLTWTLSAELACNEIPKSMQQFHSKCHNSVLPSFVFPGK